MGSQQTIKPESGLIKIPENYPTEPTAGKLELLLQNNDKTLYRRYSPYVGYADGFIDKVLNFGGKEPFIYNYIDEANKGINGTRKYEPKLFPLGSGTQDVVRITKFLTSGKGVAFLGKQFLYQNQNSFNETRIYNPTSPIVAAGMSLTLGAVRPLRHLDIYNGLGGIVRSLIGTTVPNLFSSPTVKAPPGTISEALPSFNLNEGAGLIRAGTANSALTRLESKWRNSGTKFSVKTLFKSFVSSIYKNFIPPNQPDAIARADEGTYGLMIDGSDRYKCFSKDGGTIEFVQRWIGGGKNIRKKSEVNKTISRFIISENGVWKTKKILNNEVSENIEGVGLVGYSLIENTNENSPGIRYENSIGVNVNKEYEASDIMLQYGEYVKENNKFISKKTDKSSIDDVNVSLENVLNSLQKSTIYQGEVPSDNRVLSSPKSTIRGYDAVFKAKNNEPGKSSLLYENGMLKAYRERSTRVVDNSLTMDPANLSIKLPGAGKFDAINTLTILPGKKSNEREIEFSSILDWGKWEPYRDDQIAFFFYDMVNDKYIPFRATVKGINESGTSEWQALNFIGRADKLYSYGGFSRSLSFQFDVLINSIIELAPTWKRINYLLSLLKPARYTSATESNRIFNRFMVPPMVELTIGDLYKDQPILFQTIGMTIPEDAIWETMNEFNSVNSEWTYLVDYFKSNKIMRSGKAFGQFPRMVTLSINCALLEKERAIAGGANFGHAPHSSNYNEDDISSYPEIHQYLVEYQKGMN